MSTPSDPNLPSDQGCGCAAQPGEPDLYNPPGQQALAYRLGTHGTIFAKMLAGLRQPSSTDPDAGILSQLTTRDGDDPSIALLDAWATTADVLTFYQERIANEGFLRTATERGSVLQLARTVGYELNPGVTASTALAFTVDDSKGSPASAVIPKGTKIQSLPVHGKQPQIFETMEDLNARIEWTALRPRMSHPQDLSSSGLVNQIYLQGTSTKVQPGDMILVKSVFKNLAHVKTVTVDAGRTRLDLVSGLDPTPWVPHVEDGRLDPPPQKVTLDGISVENNILKKKWSDADLNTFLAIQQWDTSDLLKLVAAAQPYPPPGAAVFALRQRVGFFGNNAPLWKTVPQPTSPSPPPPVGPYPNDWEGQSIWNTSQGPPYSDILPADVLLERSVPEVVTDSWVVIEGAYGTAVAADAYQVRSAMELSAADYALSGKCTGLSLSNVVKIDIYKFRTTTAYVQSEALQPADVSLTDPVATYVDLDRLVLGLQLGQPVVLTGEQSDVLGAIVTEVAIITKITHIGGYTRIEFDPPLQYSYARQSLTINANVVRATNGETVAGEVMGSGDGAQLNQRFTLKKAPLTYLSAPTATGGESTLEVRVNDVLWQEVPSLYGLSARDQSYILRIDDSGQATVTFGDGKSGARPATGQENITATYRTGIGPDGNVLAGSLILMQTRVLGIRGVTNPLAAMGGASQEHLDRARDHAPRAALILDRVVSLQDYEDFASAFAGIGKAQATLLSQNGPPLVHLTVAGEDGAAVDTTTKDGLGRSLFAALQDHSEATQPVVVQTYNPQLFQVHAQVLYDRRYLYDKVYGAIIDALRSAFAFDKRDFGQPVASSEVINVIQQVDGVIATFLTAPPDGGLLDSPTAGWNTPPNAIEPTTAATLLLIDPSLTGINIDLKVAT